MLYDDRGRIYQSGVYTGDNLTDPRTLSYTELYGYFETPGYPGNMGDNVVQSEVTLTIYDEPFPGIVLPITQEHLRNRVAHVVFFGDDFLDQRHAIHYSYDVHGNVKTLISEFPELSDHKRYFQVDYDYDLVSGNVKRVDAPGFSHRYAYDADNRITNVYTSVDSGHTWQQDAKYFYYAHGPLARTELGHRKVQGIDHVYTAHGWLKALNGDRLNPEHEVGQDAHSALHANVAEDAFGLSLGYYHSHHGAAQDDYTAINATAQAELLVDLKPGGTASALLDHGEGLFNGNIGHTTTALAQFAGNNPILGTAYKHDQLNRLVESVTYTENTGDQWTTTPHPNLRTSSYYTSYEFDSNGNVVRLIRNGGDAAHKMDHLIYHYEEGTNKLQYVDDHGPTGTGPYDTDIEDQAAGNFDYDEDGSMNADVSEEIEAFEWWENGKIKKVRRTAGSTASDVAFHYDGMGNRILEIEMPRNGSGVLPQEQWVYTYHLRDADGNLLCSYDRDIDDLGNNLLIDQLNLKEAMIYGSDRIGTRSFVQTSQESPQSFMGGERYTYVSVDADGYYTGLASDGDLSSSAPTNHFTHEEGHVRYELKNQGNSVLATVLDKRMAVADGSGDIGHFEAVTTTATAYYPFGMQMPGQGYNSDSYEYGFNGKRMDNEIHGSPGTSYDFGARIYDPRTGRFLSIDPRAPDFPWLSTYAFAANNPIRFIDENGEGPGDGPFTGRASMDAGRVQVFRITTDQRVAMSTYLATASFLSPGAIGTSMGLVQATASVVNEPNAQGGIDMISAYGQEAAFWLGDKITGAAANDAVVGKNRGMFAKANGLLKNAKAGLGLFGVASAALDNAPTRQESLESLTFSLADQIYGDVNIVNEGLFKFSKNATTDPEVAERALNRLYNTMSELLPAERFDLSTQDGINDAMNVLQDNIGQIIGDMHENISLERDSDRSSN